MGRGDAGDLDPRHRRTLGERLHPGGQDRGALTAAPLRIAFLDSWLTDPARGSGSSAAIAGLRAGLESLGHRVDTWRPEVRGRSRSDPGLTAGPALTARRVAFNLRLRRIFPEADYDLVVGFDLDGFALPRAPDRSPAGAGGPRRVACLKGIVADELRFEAGATRAHMALLARLERRAAWKADRVFVPSRYSRRQVEILYGLPPERTRVVPEGIHLDDWPDPDDGPDLHGPAQPNDSTEPVILSVARQYRRKDTATLLRAMPAVLERHPGARLRVVGDGPELPALRRLRSELGLQDSVALLGELSSWSAVKREYRRADLFCLPSLQEGFGIAYLEAMAARLPVVACRAGAAPEVIEDGVTGLLCAPGRPGELARAAGALLADPNRRAAMGRAGQRTARRHSWRRVARIFLQRATAPSVGDGV